MLCRLISMESEDEALERSFRDLKIGEHNGDYSYPEEFFFIIPGLEYLYSGRPRDIDILKSFELYSTPIIDREIINAIVPLQPIIREGLEWGFEGVVTCTEREYQALKQGIPLPHRITFSLEDVKLALTRRR